MNKFLLSSAGGASFIVLFTILTVVVFAVFVWLLAIGLKGYEPKFNLKCKHLFFIVLAVGAVIRMAVAFLTPGLVGTQAADTMSRAGLFGMTKMTEVLLDGGFGGFLDAYESMILYPVSMYILALFGSICRLFTPLDISNVVTVIFMKLPFIIADVMIAYVLFKIAIKYTSEFVAMAVGGFVALCPIFMLGSIWPSVYTFFALAVVIMLYFMLERKYIALTITYAVSLMICFEASFLFPIIAVYLIYAYIKKIVAYRKAKNVGKLWGSEYGLLVKLPVTIVGCLVGAYLLTLPFALGSEAGADPFAALYVYCLKPYDTFEYYTFNGVSLYTIFDKNGVDLVLSFPTFVFSIIFMIALVAVTLIVYLSKKNRANLTMFVSYLLLTVNVYFVNSSELTLLPCLAALLVAIVIIKDRRLLRILGILSLFVFLNAAGVLVKADYMQLGALYVDELLSDSWMALAIISSVATVLTHLYYTMVMLDIVMNGRIKRLSTQNNGFGSAMRELIKIKD